MGLHYSESEAKRRFGIELPVQAKAKTQVVGDHYPYRSRPEYLFAQNARILLKDLFKKNIAVIRYEEIVFRLPGGKYTPDFHVVMEDGHTVFIEVKGSKHDRGYARQRSKLRAAAELHPYWTFIQAIAVNPDRFEWSFETIKPMKSRD